MEISSTSSVNPIAEAADWYRRNGPSPLVTALLAGAAAYGTGRLAWGPAVDTARSLLRPLGARAAGGDATWNLAMDNLKGDSSLRRWLPAAGGLLTAGGVAYLLGKANQPGWGLTDWYAAARPGVDRPAWGGQTFVKTGSLDPYMQDIDWSHPVNLGVARELTGPASGIEDDGVRLTGTAIVNNAAARQATMYPTLGGIYDSAVDKISTKLTLGTALKAGVRSVVANQAARLFTSALGTVCGLPGQARQALVDAGTWAGAVTAILN